MDYLNTIFLCFVVTDSFLIIMLELKGTLRDLTKAGRAITYDQNEGVCILRHAGTLHGLTVLILLGKFY